MRVDPLIRLTADDNGETACVVFTDKRIKRVREDLAAFNARIISELPFIGALGVYVDALTLDGIAELEGVTAVAGQTCAVAL